MEIFGKFQTIFSLQDLRGEKNNIIVKVDYKKY